MCNLGPTDTYRHRRILAALTRARDYLRDTGSEHYTSDVEWGLWRRLYDARILAAEEERAATRTRDDARTLRVVRRALRGAYRETYRDTLGPRTVAAATVLGSETHRASLSAIAVVWTEHGGLSQYGTRGGSLYAAMDRRLARHGLRIDFVDGGTVGVYLA